MPVQARPSSSFSAVLCCTTASPRHLRPTQGRDGHTEPSMPTMTSSRKEQKEREPARVDTKASFSGPIRRARGSSSVARHYAIISVHFAALKSYRRIHAAAAMIALDAKRAPVVGKPRPMQLLVRHDFAKASQMAHFLAISCATRITNITAYRLRRLSAW